MDSLRPREITFMFNKPNVAAVAFSVAVLLAPPTYPQSRTARSGMGHVLLISIDGMHALDYLNCVSAGYCPHLAALGTTGVNYTRTSTSQPSDSFPGLMALVTGGTPKTVGAFYDVAYDRVLAPPMNTTGNGLAGGPCVQQVPNGTTTEYEEGVEINQTLLNGGGPYGPTDGGILSIDPTRLPRDPFNRCQPVYPWNFIRTNTIYGVIHAAGGYTAWSDKHAVYDAVGGPTGTSAQPNVDDYYSPEVNSNAIALPGVITADGQSCSVPGTPPTPPDNNGGDWTTSFLNIKCYDQLKVNAIVNEINGQNHLGTSSAPVPNILGMNFQAVSVGQKLIEKGVKGGYSDAAGTPTANMKSEIVFVDAAIGQMVAALQKQDLLSDTVIVVTAKHGQSPIDTNRFMPIGSTSPANLLAAAGLIPASESPLTPGGIGPTEDDISQLWLVPNANVPMAVGILESNAAAAGIGQIFYGSSLLTMFNSPGLPTPGGPCCALLPGGDPRTPDIIVQPNVGVVYTGSTKKQAEHGGFAHDDTNVILLVSNPNLQPATVTSFVETTQVAPTILQVLGLSPASLQAVQAEGTPVLPGLNNFTLVAH